LCSQRDTAGSVITGSYLLRQIAANSTKRTGPENARRKPARLKEDPLLLEGQSDEPCRLIIGTNGKKL
jgi:hypothetical protein